MKILTFEVKSLIPTGVEGTPFNLRLKSMFLVGQKSDPDVGVRGPGHILCGQFFGLVQKTASISRMPSSHDNNRANDYLDVCPGLKLSFTMDCSCLVCTSQDTMINRGKVNSTINHYM